MPKRRSKPVRKVDKDAQQRKAVANILAAMNIAPVEKVWGQEFWLGNGADEPYCVKILAIKPGAKCSVHMHPIKDERFLVMSGVVELQHGGSRRLLRPGDSQRILPGEYHRFGVPPGMPTALILESSTHHEDSDVVRLLPSVAPEV